MRNLSNRSALTFFIILAAQQGALALDRGTLPAPDFYGPGSTQQAGALPTALNATGIGGLSPNTRALVRALRVDIPPVVTRGSADVSLFKSAANSVVLIMTKDGIGSGSLLRDNLILTNYHVVGTEKTVTVVFKPTDASGKPKPNEILDAQVVKTDQGKDLALLRLKGVPPYQVKAFEISAVDAPDIGSDVAAIGHPTGEAWTYTKGIISQVRVDYEWTTSKNGPAHKATVIQTQTPINPGNSGGPLLSSDGKIVGVNSFRTKGSEGLNFAVASGDVTKFINQPEPPTTVAAKTCDTATIVYEGRNKKDDAHMRSVSLKCDTYADIVYVLPDLKSDPMIAIIDFQRTGTPEGVVYDTSRSGKWSASIWDPKLDDIFPLKGLHKDGRLMPVKYEDRCPPGTTPLKNLKCSR